MIQVPSEDCLYLNVATPGLHQEGQAVDQNASLPVMVSQYWINVYVRPGQFNLRITTLSVKTSQFLEGLLQTQSSFHTCDKKSRDQLSLIKYGDYHDSSLLEVWIHGGGWVWGSIIITTIITTTITTIIITRCGSTEAAGCGGAGGPLPPTRTSLWTRLGGLAGVYGVKMR